MARVTIPVNSRAEAAAVQVAMQDPTTRAFVAIVGALLPLAPPARARVLTFVTGHFEERAQREAAAAAAETTEPRLFDGTEAVEVEA